MATTETRRIGGDIWRMDATMEEINNELMDNGGEITEEMVQRIEGAELTAEGVVDGIRALASKVSAENDAIADEIKRLQALKKARTNAVEGLKRYLLSYMLRNRITRIESPTCTASIRNNAESVECDEEAVLAPFMAQVERLREELPAYVKVKVEVGKTELKKAMQDGQPTAGAQLVRTMSVQIK